MSDQSPSLSTKPPWLSGTNGWEKGIRLVAFALVGLLLALGATGLLGVRTTSEQAIGNEFGLTVIHASVTRPGLATPFSILVTRSDATPLPSQVTIQVDSAYLAMFDDNGMEPLPVSSFNESKSTWWTFEVPAGQTELRVDLDARIEPAVQWGRSATVAVSVDGVTKVEADFTTWVLP